MLINMTFYQEITCPQWGSNQIKKARLSTTLFPVIVATILSVQIPQDNDICYRAYERHLDCSEHEIGKRNTQKIERKKSQFQAWIKRLVLRKFAFSKDETKHDTVIGQMINKVEFRCDIYA